MYEKVLFMMNQIISFCRKNWLLCVLTVVIGFILFNQYGTGDSQAQEGKSIAWDIEEDVDKPSQSPSSAKNSPEQSVESKDSYNLKVDIKGAIKQPGVYEFTKGERVTDAILKAGGLTKNAENKEVNMAQLLKDEMVIYIPRTGEKTAPIQTQASNSSIPPGSGDNMNPAQKTININAATVEELQTLPGIGPSKAAAILQKREELGMFKAVEDLKQVTGIGEKTFEKLKDAISIQ